MQQRFDLWEGCISWTLPAAQPPYVDARTIRDYPQNQEVFVAPPARGDAWMMDLMEPVAAATPVAVLAEHWAALLEANDSACPDGVRGFAARVRDVAGGPAMVAVDCVVGVQRMQADGSLVRVWLCVVRRPGTDIVVAWNQPPAAEALGGDDTFAAVLASIEWRDLSFMD